MIELHVAIPPTERLAVALWILHTYVFDRYDVTPRLALISPVRGCGKTTLLILLALLTLDADRSDNVTAAAIYRKIARGACTLLIDEVDNQDLFKNSTLRALFNSGHHRGGMFDRCIDGRDRKFPTFAPLVTASIGMLPLPLMHRAIVINMQRASGGPTLKRLDMNSPQFHTTREQIRRWAATCTLALDPQLPLYNRGSDNWRPLIAMADDLKYGEQAREAAVALTASRPDEDISVLALISIRNIFMTNAIDRISSEALIKAMHGLDDGLWLGWRGLKDDRQPHKLTQAELAHLLDLFGIRPRTVRPINGGSGSKTFRADT